MARDLTAGAIFEVTNDALTPILLVKLNFDGGALTLWNGVGDLVYSGDTYTGAGDLGGVSTWVETEEIRATGLTFSLSAIPASIISSALTENYQGRSAKVYLGFLNNDENATNLLVRSETFDNASWIKTGSMDVTADSAVAPDANTTADTLDDTSAGQDQVYQNGTIVDDSETYVWSVFMKAGTSSNVSMNLHLRGGSALDTVGIFDLANGLFLPTAGGTAPDAMGMKSFGNGWWRCWVERANNSSGNTTGRCYIHPAHSATFEVTRDNSYTGDCYGWGAMLEKSSIGPTSYIPTTSATVIRHKGAIIDTPYLIFDGRMDVMTIEENGETANITLSAETILIALERANERRYTEQDQKDEYAGDTFFDYVTQLQDSEVIWGS